jgi:hypothetical protein
VQVTCRAAILLVALPAAVACSREAREVAAGSVLFEVMEGPVVTGADLDGDGVRELVVANGGFLHAAPCKPVCSVRGFAARTGWRVVRSLEGDACFGRMIACGGDMDADRADDLLIATSDAVQAWSGREGVKPLWELPFHEGDVVYAVGDADADGRDDVALGLLPGLDEVEVRTVSGADGSTLWSRRFSTSGANDRWLTAIPVHCVGDMNGDGVRDLAVMAGGRPGTGSSPRAEVISGRDGSALSMPAAWSEGIHLGAVLVGVDDLDGDALGDILVGDDEADGGDDRHGGSVAAYSGQTGLLLWRQWGPDHDDEFGHSVASVGDANGDGIPDVLAGAPRQPDEDVTGYAVLLSGADGTWLHRWEGSFETTEFELSMPRRGNRFGWCVSGIGDVNGDGFADLVVGESCYHDFPQRAVVLAGGKF